MKTAMQQVIEEVEKYFDDELSNSSNFLILLNSYLEAEKQQIIDAYEKGADDGINDGGEDSENYYNETFSK